MNDMLLLLRIIYVYFADVNRNIHSYHQFYRPEIMERLLNVLTLLLISCALSVAETYAGQLGLPAIFSSDMVLQQGRNAPVWGEASPGEKVKVKFDRQIVGTKADKNGHWRVDLKPMAACSNPRTLTVSGKDTTITYDNVLVGEVWFCSGQSNMVYKMDKGKYADPKKGKDKAAEELKKRVNENIRIFVARHDGYVSGWSEATGDALAQSSAPAYFFGKQLRDSLDVPVGIITSAVNGTRIEPWTPTEAYYLSEIFAKETERDGMIDGKKTGDLYDRMVAPFAPYAVRGFLWYQGESNIIDRGRERRYADKFKILTESWRRAFENEEAPFYYVLLAPHVYSMRSPRSEGLVPSAADELPLFWQQQIAIRDSVPNTEYVCIWDLVDNPRDIHPSYKWKVGERLAGVALSKAYGHHKIEYSGPRAVKATASDGAAIIEFSHVADGLKSSDGRRLGWFEIAGEDGIFMPALADIEAENKIRVWLPEIPEPKVVRLGWSEIAMPNLMNSAGLPASPFVIRTE